MNQIKYFFKLIFVSNHRLTLWVVIGLLIRLILIPFSTHLDLLLSTYREYLWAQEEIQSISMISEGILALYMKLFLPFFKYLPEALQTDRYGIVGLPEHLKFSMDSFAPRNLFLLKFPFLIFDLGFLWVLMKFAKDKKEQIIVSALWALNVLMLYSVFAFGRYEIMPVLALTGSLFLAKNKKIFWALILFSFAISLKTYVVILAPIYLIYFSNGLRSLLKNILILVIPFFSINYFTELIFGKNLIAGIGGSGLMEFANRGSVGEEFNRISLFIVAYALVGIFYFYKKREADFWQFFRFLFLAFLSYFIFAYFHSHYLVWLSPFLILYLLKNKKILWPTILMLIFFFILVDISTNRVATSLIFAPADWRFFSQIQIFRLQFFYNLTTSNLITVFHTLYILTAGLIGYIIYRNEIKN